MDWTEIAKNIITVGVSLYGFELFKDWLAKRKEKRTQKEPTDYSSDYSKKSKVKPILDDILYELEPSRVQYWEFSNGEKTLSGHHLKKLSLFMESNAERVKEIAPHFQFVPVKQFERNLDKLYESEEDFIVSLEAREFDDLASLFSQYGIKTVLSIKVKNEIGVWVGVLSVCFKNERILNEGEISFAKLQALKLSTIK
jgi:hypothetical protein